MDPVCTALRSTDVDTPPRVLARLRALGDMRGAANAQEWRTGSKDRGRGETTLRAIVAAGFPTSNCHPIAYHTPQSNRHDGKFTWASSASLLEDLDRHDTSFDSSSFLVQTLRRAPTSKPALSLFPDRSVQISQTKTHPA